MKKILSVFVITVMLSSMFSSFAATTKFVRHGGKIQRAIDSGAEQKEAAKVEASVKPAAKK